LTPTIAARKNSAVLFHRARRHKRVCLRLYRIEPLNVLFAKKKTISAPRKGPPRITATMFYKHLRCPHWVYWDIHGDESDKAEVNELTQKIWEHGVVHEKEVVGHYGDFDEVPEYGDENDLFERTAELMGKAARSFITVGSSTGAWVGVPDLLFKNFIAFGPPLQAGRLYLRTLRHQILFTSSAPRT